MDLRVVGIEDLASKRRSPWPTPPTTSAPCSACPPSRT